MSEDRWFVRVDRGEPLGPMPEETLLRGIAAGKVPPDALVCQRGWPEWLPISTVEPFVNAALKAQDEVTQPTTRAASGARLDLDPPWLTSLDRSRVGRRRDALRLCALFFSLPAAAALLVMATQDTRTAEGAASSLLAALSAGDVAALRTRRELGAAGRVQAAIQQEGSRELERRRKLLARAQGAKLSADERADIADLPETDEAARAFIDRHGAAQVARDLRRSMAAGGFQIEATRYRGPAPRSALRGASAEVELRFDPEREATALRWLPERLTFRYNKGRYRAVEPAEATPGAKDEPPALADLVAQGASRPPERRPGEGLPGAETLVVGLVVAGFGWLLRRRGEGLSPTEGAAALGVFLVAALQHTIEGQVNADDWLATPLYLLVPCLLGLRGGPLGGAIGGGLVGAVLLTGATLFHPPASPPALLDVVPVGDYALVALVLGAMGALAGLLATRLLLVAFLPLLWILGSALLQPDILWSASLYGRCSLAVVLLALLLAWRPPEPAAQA